MAATNGLALMAVSIVSALRHNRANRQLVTSFIQLEERTENIEFGTLCAASILRLLIKNASFTMKITFIVLFDMILWLCSRCRLVGVFVATNLMGICTLSELKETRFVVSLKIQLLKRWMNFTGFVTNFFFTLPRFKHSIEVKWEY